jgi:type IV pilus assembly protein PilM
MGLDIGSSSVKAIELKPSRSGFRVTAIGVEPLPRQTFVDEGAAERATVADAVGRLLGRKEFRATDVALSLSGHSVIVKKIVLPAMSPAELAQSIVWEAEQYIPFHIHDVNLDYEVLNDGTGADGRGTMEVLLVAAKKETIANYTTVVAEAGRRAAVMDVDAFALQNAYEVNYGFEPGTIVALLNIGGSATNVNIVSGSQSVFTRDISMGGQAFTDALQRELEIEYEVAELLKRGVAAQGAKPEDARPVLRAVTENLLVELQKTFDFYKSTATSDRIDRLMISGGGSRVEGLVEALQERFHATAERFDPFRQVHFDAAALGADAQEMAPIAAVAVGLALRRAGDR